MFQILWSKSGAGLYNSCISWLNEDENIEYPEKMKAPTSSLLFLDAFFFKSEILRIIFFNNIACLKFFSGFRKHLHFLIDVSQRQVKNESVSPEM